MQSWSRRSMFALPSFFKKSHLADDQRQSSPPPPAATGRIYEPHFFSLPDATMLTRQRRNTFAPPSCFQNLSDLVDQRHLSLSSPHLPGRIYEPHRFFRPNATMPTGQARACRRASRPPFHRASRYPTDDVGLPSEMLLRVRKIVRAALRGTKCYTGSMWPHLNNGLESSGE
jgi:hypothetical protein